ncbi:MAG: 3'(2'),5'-bisphosphate nucleotidase CysQ family protein [Gammaproteobacteria bacterium]
MQLVQRPFQKEDILPLADSARGIIRAAAREVMGVYQQYLDDLDFEIQSKQDGSPLTIADRISHQVLCDGLRALSPVLPIVSEEGKDSKEAPVGEHAAYWLLDPLDGTKEFLARNGEFTVNIALMQGSKTVWGAVSVPAQDCVYEGGPGLGCRLWHQMSCQSIQTVSAPRRQCRVLFSRSHSQNDQNAQLVQQLRAHFDQTEQLIRGSSLKLCSVASGEADLYPRLGPIRQWDIAAGHAVLVGAGGTIMHMDGTEITYGGDTMVPISPFIAVGDASIDWLAILN